MSAVSTGSGTFQPIAIVGAGCVLPGALSPDELWEAILQGRDLLSFPDREDWGIAPDRITSGHAAAGEASSRGGYVRGFETVFDPSGFSIPPGQVRALDRSTQWILHAARAALAQAGLHDGLLGERTGVVLGNLSLPTRSFARYAEAIWLDGQGTRLVAGKARQIASGEVPDPRAHFMSGLPAHLLAQALGLGAGAVALDAACASSLYAIKLACDALHDRRAEVMVAGAVCGTDGLFLHLGFRALGALSLSGQSRPFHRDADGLVTAEGAGCVVLRRLEDAVEAGETILGVIRAVGLSNDGGAAGILTPSTAGQIRAMHQAYLLAALEPADISLLECHATGTPVGDAIEIQSTGRIYAGLKDVPIGSLKSNTGHLLAAAGIAGLLKVLGALRTGVRPPAIHTGAALDLLDSSPFRLLTAPEPWIAAGLRRAAVSAFGMGGNNAHLLVEEWDGEQSRKVFPVASPSTDEDLAIVAIGVVAAGAPDTETFTRAVLSGRSLLTECPGPTGEPPMLRGVIAQVVLQGAAAALRFPPRDLAETLPQQLLILAAAQQALAGAGALPAERTGVLIGMGCDAEVARHAARARVQEWAPCWANAAGALLDDEWVARAQRGIGAPLTSAAVVGTLPNVTANRLNTQFKLAGPSFTLSGEELSGIAALQTAARALRTHELDAAVVGAVDLSCEPAHEAAARQLLGPDRQIPGDAAVVLVLRRLSDAQREGCTIHAVLPAEPPTDPGTVFGSSPGAYRLEPLTGHAHAASGLLYVAAAALSCAYRALPASPGQGPVPWLRSGTGPRTAVVRVDALGGQSAIVALAEDPDTPSRPILPEGWSDSPAATTRGSRRGSRPAAAPAGGEIAFVFTGSAAGYPGMGRELLLAFPELVDRVGHRLNASAGLGWVYGSTGIAPAPLEMLAGTSFLCQIHAELTRQVLDIQPSMALGLSSGETNAIAAMGAWPDLGGLLTGLRDSGLYSRQIGGELQAVRRAWNLEPDRRCAWASWRLVVPVERVRQALAGETRVYLTLIHTPEDCVIAGDPEACGRVIDRLGPVRAHPAGIDLAVHCPVVNEVAAEWRALHRRPTVPVPGVRFYGVDGVPYPAEIDTVADALLRMATTTVDFPRMVERAWQDGARIFIEHGPRNLCSRWIDRILGEREHLAVALDRAGRSPLEQVRSAIEQLREAGIPIEGRALEARLRGANGRPPPAPGTTAPHSYPAHLPPVVIPELLVGTAQTMQPAPVLPPPDEQPGETPTHARVDSDHQPPAVIRAPAAVSSSAPAADATQGKATGGDYTDLLHHLTAVHLEHLGRLRDTQQRFLAAQASAWQALLGTASGERRSPLRLSEAVESGAMQYHPAPPAGGSAASRQSADGEKVRFEVPRSFTRADLEFLASGRIPAILGPLFAPQESYSRQVRLPEPPLLLVDRVLDIEGEPGTMGLGRITTETDVRADAWYLHQGCMPAGIQIEAGQADLLLISWLGVDLLNQGRRVYRLLGCELTFHGPRPRAGETLRYEIGIDRHVHAGGVRLFLFHYTCHSGDRVCLSVRHGQAGFFDDEELRTSGGVVWDAQVQASRSLQPGDAPARLSARRAFSAAQVRAFAGGRAHECFGPGFERALSHTRSPRIQDGRMLLLHDVTHFEPEGGPLGRGYLCAETPITGDEWFFPGHFAGDPTMPGTLMLEGCLQAMSFYLAALGFTLERDGWRFEIAPDVPYTMECRGQIVPSSRRVRYEVFVLHVDAGPQPTLAADVLLSVDGLKAFACRDLRVTLVPDWPLSTLGGLLAGQAGAGPVAHIGDLPLDYRALLTAAWGRPSDAFTARYRDFDGHRFVPRLPGPPYLFISRVTQLQGEFAEPVAGASVECAYDVPPDAWYFGDRGANTMPFCVLLEVALQPCGWLTAYAGIPLSTETDLRFRNLGGKARVYHAVGPEAGTVRTIARMTGLSRYGETWIESFEVACYVGEEQVFGITTSFGHFTREALAEQTGLPPDPTALSAFHSPDESGVDLSTLRSAKAGCLPGMPAGLRDTVASGILHDRSNFPAGNLTDEMWAGAQPSLALLGRITSYQPQGGAAGLGRLRVEMPVDPAAWFFRAHFLGDPVQPGSIGVEAMLQALRMAMVLRGIGSEETQPRFEAPALDREITITFRGQVLPENRIVVIELELTEVGHDERGEFAAADAWLWVDGMRIYHVQQLTGRLVTGAAGPICDLPTDGEMLDRCADRLGAPDPWVERSQSGATVQAADEVLDPAGAPWLADHCPTYTRPALPLMCMADRMAAAALAQRPDMRIVGLHDVRVHRWLLCDGPVRLHTSCVPADGVDGAFDVTLQAWRSAGVEALSRFEPVATGRIFLAAQHRASPEALPPLEDALPAPSPYSTDAVFHGPAFHVVRALAYGTAGSSAVLAADGGAVPAGAVRPVLLDGITHTIPNADLNHWSDAISTAWISYPVQILEATFHQDPPVSGEVRCEVRFDGFQGTALPRFRAQLIVDGRVWVDMRLVQSLFPKGPIGSASGTDRRRFLRDKDYVPGLRLARMERNVTRLSAAEVHASDWLPGTVAAAYGANTALEELTREIAIKDHLAHRLGVHPSTVRRNDAALASCTHTPLTCYPLAVQQEGNDVVVRDGGPPGLDLEPVRTYWRRRLGADYWPLEDVYFAMAHKFVRQVRIEDPEALRQVRARSVLYVANHQVAIESFLFTLLMPALMDAPLVAIAKSEVRGRWLADFLALAGAYPGIVPPDFIVYIDQQDPAAVLKTFSWCTQRMKQDGLSALLHVEGTRALHSRHRVSVISSTVIDMALEADAPIVPVRFTGGLPVKPLDRRLHLPVGHGSQDYLIGRPLLPATLRALPYAHRRSVVLEAINALGAGRGDEVPNPADPAFERESRAWADRTGAEEEDAVLLKALERLREPGAAMRPLLDAVHAGTLRLPATPEGHWLAEFARRLFGERGPRVIPEPSAAPVPSEGDVADGA